MKRSKPAPNNFGMLHDLKMKKEAKQIRVQEKYEIQGFISSGTYGRVYKAKAKEP